MEYQSPVRIIVFVLQIGAPNIVFTLEIIFFVCTKQAYLCVHVRPPHALRGKVNAAPRWE